VKFQLDRARARKLGWLDAPQLARIPLIGFRIASLNRRRLAKPAAKAISIKGRLVSEISFLANSVRRLSATTIGGMPRCSHEQTAQMPIG